jgi:hypothetical protein
MGKFSQVQKDYGLRFRVVGEQFFQSCQKIKIEGGFWKLLEMLLFATFFILTASPSILIVLDEIWDLKQTFIDTLGDIILAAIIITIVNAFNYWDMIKLNSKIYSFHAENLYVLGLLGHCSTKITNAPLIYLR